jgi:hypothetical protein
MLTNDEYYIEREKLFYKLFPEANKDIYRWKLKYDEFIKNVYEFEGELKIRSKWLDEKQRIDLEEEANQVYEENLDIVSDRSNNPELYILESDDLNTFRQKYSGEWVLNEVLKSIKALLRWPIGVGKSYNIDSLIEASLKKDAFDVIIVLAPRVSILKERKLIQNNLSNGDGGVVFLRGRNEAGCPPALNAAWKKIESKGLGLIGRQKICRSCNKKAKCFWLNQYDKKRLKNANVIFATQQQIVNNPQFIEYLLNQTGAKSHLVVYDEADMLLNPLKPKILLVEDIRNFLEVLETSISYEIFKGRQKKSTYKLIKFVRKLLIEIDPKEDGDEDEDKLTPREYNDAGELLAKLDYGWWAALQKLGYKQLGDYFKFIMPELRWLFNNAEKAKAEILENGDIAYHREPFYGDNYVIYSGFTSHNFICQRLKNYEIEDSFAAFKFGRLDTKFYNIADKKGMQTYFPGNKNSILYFFACLTIKRIKEGKKVLYISKKMFTKICVRTLNKLFAQLGHPELKVTNRKKFTSKQLCDPNVIPLITYGSVGVNDFQEFDCAYCLNGYYTSDIHIWPYLDEYVKSKEELRLMIVNEEGDGKHWAEGTIRRRPVLFRNVDSYEKQGEVRKASMDEKREMGHSIESAQYYLDNRQKVWDKKIDEASFSSELTRLEYDENGSNSKLFTRQFHAEKSNFDKLKVNSINNQLMIRDIDWFQFFAFNVLEFLETNTVLQAIGRVRPFTKPREIITFQIPIVDTQMIKPNETFHSIAAARDFFDIETARQGKANETAKIVKKATSRGMTVLEITERYGISKSTVYRYRKEQEENAAQNESVEPRSVGTMSWKELGFIMQFTYEFGDQNRPHGLKWTEYANNGYSKRTSFCRL